MNAGDATPRNAPPDGPPAPNSLTDDTHGFGLPIGQMLRAFRLTEKLGEGAMGLVILIDSARPDPMADLDLYLDSFRETIRKCDQAVVIGVTRTELNPQVDFLDRVNERVAKKKLNIPVFEVDGRQRDDVKQLLLALLTFFDPSTSRSKAA